MKKKKTLPDSKSLAEETLKPDILTEDKKVKRYQHASYEAESSSEETVKIEEVNSEEENKQESLTDGEVQYLTAQLKEFEKSKKYPKYLNRGHKIKIPIRFDYFLEKEKVNAILAMEEVMTEECTIRGSPLIVDAESSKKLKFLCEDLLFHKFENPRKTIKFFKNDIGKLIRYDSIKEIMLARCNRIAKYIEEGKIWDAIGFSYMLGQEVMKEPVRKRANMKNPGPKIKDDIMYWGGRIDFHYNNSRARGKSIKTARDDAYFNVREEWEAEYKKVNSIVTQAEPHKNNWFKRAWRLFNPNSEGHRRS